MTSASRRLSAEELAKIDLVARIEADDDRADFITLIRELRSHIAALEADIAAAEARAPTDAARDVLAERQRQISVEGWTPEHDDNDSRGELAAAAGCYALEFSCADHGSAFPRLTLPDGVPKAWPWSPEWWKPTDRRRNLVKAGALILAAIEQIDRAAMQPQAREGA